MALPSGLSAQLGFAAETTYGTEVTPTRFRPLVDESIETTIENLESAGIIAGAMIRRSSQWSQGLFRHEGDVGLELTTRTIGLLMEHALGSSTSASTQQPWTWTFTPGDLTGKGLTFQVGRPDRGGTVRPFTYAGTKIQSWEVGLAAGEIATLGLSVVAQSMTTGTALASAVYASTSDSPFNFTAGSFSLAGSSLCVRSARVSGENNLTTDRICIGHNYIEQPVQTDLRNITGELEIEFPDLYHWERFVAGTEGALSLVLQSGTQYSFTIAANVRTDAASPTVSGRDMVMQPFSFTAVGTNSDASAITCTYVTADTQL